MPASTAKAFIIGEALIDAVHSLNGQHQELPGGSPANVALTLARQGGQSSLLTWIADDERGNAIEQWLKESGVTLHPSSMGAAHTSVANAHLQADGSAQYEFEIEWDLTPVTIDPEFNVVHTGSIAATIEPGSHKVLELIKNAADHATITYDPNARPSLMGSPDLVRPLIEQYVALSDVVKVSDEDLGWLYPDQPFTQVAQKWSTSGPALTIVTKGGEGATCYTPNFTVEIVSPKVTVADTVGAGDSFMGTLIYELGERGYLGKSGRLGLHNIDRGTVEDVLTQCAKVAAITVSRAGANPPWRNEL